MKMLLKAGVMAGEFTECWADIAHSAFFSARYPEQCIVLKL